MGISRDHYNVGNIGNAFFKGALARFGKSQWSSFASGVTAILWENNNIFEGALARFGKISMEFLHLGGLQGNHCEIWENLNGVPSLGGFTRESNSCLKGAGDKYSHGPMRSTVWGINWGKLTHGEQWMGLCRADLGKSGEK